MRKSVMMVIIAVALMSTQKAVAQELWQIEKQFTAIWLVYLNGHDNDLNSIEGVDFTADLYWNGSKIGTTTGQMRFLTPPLNLTQKYAPATLKCVNSIPGNGSYQVNAQGLVMFISDVYSGKGTFTYAGSICNGKDNLESMVGLADGIGEFDLMKETGTVQETISVRMGY